MPLSNRPYKSPLPDYGLRYFEHLLADFEELPATEPRLGTGQEILQKYKENPRSLTWGDVYRFDRLILSLQPEATLRRRAWTLRTKYREVAGQNAYDKYLVSKPPDENSRIEDLRADMKSLLDQLHWYYSLIPIRESMRTGVTRAVVIGILIYAVLLGIVLGWMQVFSQTVGSSFWAIVFVVAFAGIVGGAISLQRRIQSIPTEGDPLPSIFEIKNGTFGLYFAPFSGAIFALVLYLLFAGGLIQGDLFPKVRLGEGIADSIEYAKLIVWSFIAGFAERLVPDALDRLVQRSQNASSGGAGVVGPSQPAGQGISPPEGEPEQTAETDPAPAADGSLPDTTK